MRVHAKVKDKAIHFSSELAHRVFFERNEGKDILIEPDEAPTAEMRRFFEGCLVPVMFYTHPKTGWKDFKEAREALKLEFLPSRTVTSIHGVPTRITSSTSELTKERFTTFVNTVVDWMVENQVAEPDALDAQTYLAWRNSAPEAEAIYPPLKRLKEAYDTAKATSTPPWRRENPPQKSKNPPPQAPK